MGEAFLGNNPEDMQELVTKINQAVEQIHQAVSGLDAKATSVQWHGQDANNFKHTEWPQHKSQLNKVAEDLRSVGQNVAKQRQQQIETSGH
ncbi:uncharacterized protein YukE [Psychromicrobium silvestre]|uniref:Uncharacterized protein YukE n=1 Tax=Psychromicrobium silvestre TaxID=1645614 RepID=A0A7Y9S8N9_9MICC|nr:hypothetical protein [Psychromicrobium silvestre]NYE96620.1 uncharacterized protein YukE [Psychromicrobium silvestre]